MNYKFTAASKARNVVDYPIWVEVPDNIDLKDGIICLDYGDKRIDCQVLIKDDKKYIVYIESSLLKGQEKTYTLVECYQSNKGVELVKTDDKIDVNIDGEFFTSYVFSPDLAKPYLGPIMASDVIEHTRLDFTALEHPHHRSIWVAIGDVNGIDFWNEPAGEYGKQIHKKIIECNSSPVMGRLTTKNIWTDFNGRELLDDIRTFTFYNTSAKGRYIDMDIVLTANYGPVEFGATKEAGPLGVRLNEDIKVSSGGNMVNCYGGMGEAECWGKRANWCDYYGETKGRVIGTAVFDNPKNMHYPTHWHIRDYGLMAPNNFYFKGGFTLNMNQNIVYSYRIYFHEGDHQKAETADKHNNYIYPPSIKWL